MPVIDDLTRRVEKLEEVQTDQHLSRLERDVRECKVGVQNVDRDVYDLSVKLERISDGLHAKIDGVEQRLDAKIDGAVQRLDAKIDGAVQRLDAKIDGAVQRLETKIDVVAYGLDTKINMLAESIRLILVHLGIKPNGS